MSTALSTLICNWPQAPLLPPPGQAVLVRVATAPSRTTARMELRAALREVLARWSGLAPERLPLAESPRGPVWQGQLAGQTLDISLSYCEQEAWIGLLRGGWIGVDVMRAEPLAEALDVARDYLGPVALESIQKSPDPTTAFAAAWTELEAQLKCLKLKLVERRDGQALAVTPCALENIFLADRVVVTLATHSPLAP